MKKALCISTPLLLLALLIIMLATQEAACHTEKIWLHRCNSIEKFIEKHADYPHVEIDIVFRENGTLDVTHDIDKTFGLSLKEYMTSQHNRLGKLWLDIKNLSSANNGRILSELNALSDSLRLCRQHIIVESGDWKSLKPFTDEGYYTSFYIHFDRPSTMTQLEIEESIAELRNIANSHHVKALSFPGYWYTTLKRELNHPIDLLTWEHHTTRTTLVLTPQGRRMLSDPQLKVILVKDKGKYHR